MLVNQLVLLAFMAFVVGTISLTITRAGIFEPVRNWAKKWAFLGKLVTCTYCTSHWVSLGAYLWFKPKIVEGTFHNLVLCVFLLVALSSVAAWIIFQCHSAIGSTEDEDE